jgi:pimeloyl-ACP methyl ester carboxylesterase
MEVTGVDAPRRLSFALDGRGPGEMAVLEWGDPTRPVDLIFVHANGFNARTYSALLEPLGGDRRIWAPDLRGHGRTTLTAQPEGRWSWDDHGADLAALVDRAGTSPLVLSGHSMGGTSSVLAAAQRRERVRALTLFDPVIWSQPAVLAFGLPGLRQLPRRIPLYLNALKRRARFDSREQARSAYEGRGAFKGWPDRMLADYVEDGLTQTDGGLALACAPSWEASNYAAQSHNPWRALRRYGGPVRILAAETGSTCHVPDKGRGLEHVRVERPAGATHFFPMIQPDLAREALRQVL